MSEPQKQRNIYPLLLVILFIIVTGAAVLANIPVLRQLSSFIFLTFLPGWLILYMLKMNHPSQTAKFVLTIGLSIAFVIFAGLLINTIYPLMGYKTPLNTPSVLISFSIFLLIMAIIAYLRNRDEFSLNLASLKLNTKEKAYLLVPAFFPLMSIIGMRIMNATSNNTMLIALLLVIPAYAVFLTIRHRGVPERVLPPIILCVAISLVLLLGLRSNHIIGVDIHSEFYLFQQTLVSGRWQVLSNSVLDACLSITIFPAVYQTLISIDAEFIFKVLYPLLFAITPLTVYMISRKYLPSPLPFLAALFLMAQTYFLIAADSPRTTLAILFFALALFVSSMKEANKLHRHLIFIIFVLACIFSHYSTTYIFFIVFSLTWILVKLAQWLTSFKGGLRAIPIEITSNSQFITGGMLMLFFLILFFWYGQVTEAAFNGGVRFINGTLNTLGGFFNIENRGTVVQLATGRGVVSVPDQITLVISWLSIALIAIGVLGAILRKPISELSNTNSPSTKQPLETEYIIRGAVCMAVLAAAVMLPNVLIGYDMTRTYGQMAVVLAPFFAVGGVALARLLSRKMVSVIILVVIIPLFFCNTGMIYYIFGLAQTFNSPFAVAINSGGIQYDALFVHDQETAVAKWLYSDATNINTIYSDYYGGERLFSQGGIITQQYASGLIDKQSDWGEGYFFLRYTGVVDGKLMDSTGHWHAIQDYQNIFEMKNLIYNNGGSEIWY